MLYEVITALALKVSVVLQGKVPWKNAHMDQDSTVNVVQKFLNTAHSFVKNKKQNSCTD